VAFTNRSAIIVSFVTADQLRAMTKRYRDGSDHVSSRTVDEASTFFVARRLDFGMLVYS